MKNRIVSSPEATAITSPIPGIVSSDCSAQLLRPAAAKSGSLVGPLVGNSAISSHLSGETEISTLMSGVRSNPSTGVKRHRNRNRHGGSRMDSATSAS
ncbi:unnamed protein product [Protopolystoma xenopodis]|uniref:Uncharacterized protein n=1 Tax=Protopolystoma xenopodis TaxID=117903 RepID=A0A448X405_9PLAT|nr:unnamed protein product [Protopolystoma xenopodis]